ncbi:peptidoglycan DD-metalloendopeptidase family protein [Patescibacteria group bacterium]|nr:peptidoglycan DD-metalloendopeptidase family protein [Patescibacteria group bacterium]
MKRIFSLALALIIFSTKLWAQAELSCLPESFGISLIEGEEMSETLVISNVGGDLLMLMAQGVSDNHPNFISQIQPSTVFLQPGQNQTVTFVVSAQSLSAGQHNGHLLLVNNDPTQPYLELEISLEVLDYFPDLKLPWLESEEWVLTCSYTCDYHSNANNSYYALDFDKPNVPEGARAPILSASSGVVIFSGWDSHYGNVIKVDAGHGYVVCYGHLAESLVVPGQEIQQGQMIGRMGSTGEATQDQLHFMLLYEGDCRSSVLQSRPEPLSGYGDFAQGAGLFYLSDNVLVDPPDQLAVFAEFKQSNSLTLLACFPNPFNPQTQLVFDLPRALDPTLKVYNLQGQLIKDLSVGQLEAGRHQLTWQASDQPAGVYFVYLQAEEFLQVSKILLLK